MKRFAALVLFLLLSLTALTGAPTLGEDMADSKTYTCGNYQYVILDDGTAEITKYTGHDEVLVIPDTLDGLSVTRIGQFAFQSSAMPLFASRLKNVTIPRGITYIGDWAFSYCENLIQVSIPDSVTHIGSGAFCGCKGLIHASVPDSVTYIGSSAFSDCQSLVSVTLPDGLTEINDSTFMNCSSMTSITIPDGVMSIGDNAFGRCLNLTSAVIPSSVTKIGSSAFAYTRIAEFTIPAGVTQIGDSAFFWCAGLTNITIPDSVTAIGDAAFAVCANLSTVVISPDHPALTVMDGALVSKNDMRLIWYPMAGECSHYEIPQGIRVIGKSAFMGCKSLITVTIPDSVTAVGDAAFAVCANLSSLVISPDHPALAVMDGALVSKNDMRLIWYPITCENSHYEIPQGIRSMAFLAFVGCQNLTVVTIPDSVTEIETQVFADCLDLVSVIIPDSVTTISPIAFTGCPNLTLTVVPGSYAEQYAIDHGIKYVYTE